VYGQIACQRRGRYVTDRTPSFGKVPVKQVAAMWALSVCGQPISDSITDVRTGNHIGKFGDFSGENICSCHAGVEAYKFLYRPEFAGTEPRS
jgi:hypothetical protein